MIVRKYVVPVLALAGLAYATHTVVSGSEPVVPALPVAPPAVSPFSSSVAGAGVIEASSENIMIGTHRGGIVSTVAVKVGSTVKRGDALFTIDERAARAELAVREAALASARQTLERLERLPRAEDVPPVEARAAQAQVNLEDRRDMLERVERAGAASAATAEEMARRRFAVQAAERELAEAQAELMRMNAGAWEQDLAVARAEVASAGALVQAATIELELLTVRAPIDGEVLQVNIRAGEHASAGDNASPLMIMGETQTLHIRVDIDENDAWRLRPGTPAVASLRGNSAKRTEIEFVRIEPLVVPKRSLTGASSERVDTRVLQAIYAFPRTSLPAYVGQLVDVYIDAGEQPAGARAGG